ncbi:MAG: hypothetical protein NTX53_07015 [candidate division WOR-3 bacterium]|nr:hypothetical protein [candidate division WOR-3 bacterium]
MELHAGTNDVSWLPCGVYFVACAGLALGARVCSPSLTEKVIIQK